MTLAPHALAPKSAFVGALTVPKYMHEDLLLEDVTHLGLPFVGMSWSCEFCSHNCSLLVFIRWTVLHQEVFGKRRGRFCSGGVVSISGKLCGSGWLKLDSASLSAAPNV